MSSIKSALKIRKAKITVAPATETAYQAVIDEVSVGTQAGRECYVAFLDFAELATLKSLVSLDAKKRVEATIEAAEMATYGQRALEPKRVCAIRDYVAKNQDNYVLPPITLSIDQDNGVVDGKLRIARGAKLHIIDGQHRMAACELLAAQLPEHQLGVFIIQTKRQSEDRQAFADINSTAKIVPMAKNIMFNGRDERAVWVQNLERYEPISRYVDWKAVCPRKGKLLAAAGLYAIAKEFGEEKSFRCFLEHYLPVAEKLNQPVFSALVVMCAYARLFEYVNFPRDNDEAAGHAKPCWEEYVNSHAVTKIDWSREAWEGICVFNGALSKSSKLVQDTFREIKERNYKK